MARLHFPRSGKHTKDATADVPTGETTGGTGERIGEDYGPDAATEHAAPDSPAELPGRSWSALLRRVFAEFKDDELTDRAAALTYYGILALFPALLVLVSLLGIAGESATQEVLDNVKKLAPGSARDVLTNAVEQLQAKAGLGSVLAVVGLVGAVWSASGYVAAFIRSANAVYDVPEG
ncbi:ribonuclease BN, partial [Streptomyces sp. SID5926]|nr:ribonuclease BN [Streptomyces sp. SID5926]